MPRRLYWRIAAVTRRLAEKSARTRSATRGQRAKLTVARSHEPYSFARGSASGTTLLELIVVLAIVGVLCAISLPSFQNTFKSAHLSAATSAVTAAIQTTRFNSVVMGCQYQLILSQATTTYQVGYEKLSGTPPTCATTFTNLNSPVSWSGTGDGVSLQSSVTLQFCPNGTVGLYSSGSTTCNATIPNIVLSNGTAETNTIIVSGAGNVKVTSP